VKDAPPYRSAPALLEELQIRHPDEIDVEAIAEYCGATVVYERLRGCEARVIGYGSRAYITVNKDSPRERQRFSVGHELGHWMRDRGRVVLTCGEGDYANQWEQLGPEPWANYYAASLLLPGKIFNKAAQRLPITFETVESLRQTFLTPKTVTAVRLVGHGSFPAMIVCNGPLGSSEESTQGQPFGRLWYVSGYNLPRNLWPLDGPGPETIAYGLLHGSRAAGGSPQDVNAAGWIDHPEAHRYRVKEDTIAVSGGRVLTLLWWEDLTQIIDLDHEEEMDGMDGYVATY
jgi:Zn-dependent peptidase ImmA (M78 family)